MYFFFFLPLTTPQIRICRVTSTGARDSPPALPALAGLEVICMKLGLVSAKLRTINYLGM